jgi:hypothetical protein
MIRDEHCPRCLSVFKDIRGVVYTSATSMDSYRCEDLWHGGHVVISGVVEWTEDDVELLRQMGIKA